MTTYEIVAGVFGEVIKKTDADGLVWWIPKNESNADYQAYLRHLAGEDESGTLS